MKGILLVGVTALAIYGLVKYTAETTGDAAASTFAKVFK